MQVQMNIYFATLHSDADVWVHCKQHCNGIDFISSIVHIPPQSGIHQVNSLGVENVIDPIDADEQDEYLSTPIKHSQ